jgi:hypothetical protein
MSTRTCSRAHFDWVHRPGERRWISTTVWPTAQFSDLAGHLQKEADENGFVISQQTLDALPEGGPFERMGVLAREQMVFYRMTAPYE